MAKGIFEAMAAVMEDVEAIGKDKTNAQQGFNYRGIDQVYNDLHPILAKYKIFTTPKVLANEREERTTTKGGTLFYSRVTMQYTFWTADGSSVECSVIGEGMDSGDKATNKAMAVAHKYALLQTFCIPTEDMPDPDAQTHEVKAPTPTPTPTKPVAPLKQYLLDKGFSKEEIKAFYAKNNVTTTEIATKIIEDKAALTELIKEFKRA